MRPEDIHITGWGAVTTLGWSASESARRLIAGDVHPAGICSSPHLINRDFKAFEIVYDGSPLEKSLAMLDASMTEAFERAGLSASEIAESALLVGTTGGIFIRNEYAFTESVRQNPGRETPPIVCRNRGPGEVADALAKKYGIRGLPMTLSMACVSSSHALVIAAQLLSQKKIKRAIVVGFEPLLNLTLQGFASLLLYDADACRPFCNTRSGMQIGEAASCVILEAGNRKETAAACYTFTGGYLFNDNSSLTSAGTDGELVKTVVQHSLNAAGIAPEQIVAIKAHGTGTRDNDLSEGRGLAKVFGDKLPPVVSLKGAIGHGLGAAGTVETALWLACLEEGTIPVSFGFTEVDPDIGFAPSQVNLPAKDGAYLFTFFGFGGTCTSYVITKNPVIETG
ncbi:MAG: beta-ketoacyl synthase N-terminal-like domain-containing protein [Smithellaceae bacterium]